eukprot:6192281-Pleurochrysis_carterae.AAC.2
MLRAEAVTRACDISWVHCNMFDSLCAAETAFTTPAAWHITRLYTAAEHKFVNPCFCKAVVMSSASALATKTEALAHFPAGKRALSWQFIEHAWLPLGGVAKSIWRAKGTQLSDALVHSKWRGLANISCDFCQLGSNVCDGVDVPLLRAHSCLWRDLLPVGRGPGGRAAAGGCRRLPDALLERRAGAHDKASARIKGRLLCVSEAPHDICWTPSRERSILETARPVSGTGENRPKSSILQSGWFLEHPFWGMALSVRQCERVHSGKWAVLILENG